MRSQRLQRFRFWLTTAIARHNPEHNMSYGAIDVEPPQRQPCVYSDATGNWAGWRVHNQRVD